jgi:dynein heavy chain 1
MDAIDEWIDRKAQGKGNLAPSAIPWDALQALMNQVIYGGRIDNEFDQSRLEAFVNSLFVAQAYDLNFPLASGWNTKDNAYKPMVTMPDTKDHAGFKAWVDGMSDVNSPELLGLPSNAESMLLSHAGEHMCYELLALQDHGGDSEGQEGEVEASEGEGAAAIAAKKKAKRLSFSMGGDVKADRPAWMVSLEASANAWLKETPDAGALPSLPTGDTQSKLLLHPLYRCFQREYNLFRGILGALNEDLTLVVKVLSGSEPANNKARALFLKLQKDQLPPEWVQYGNSIKKVPTSLWVSDFTKRVNQIAKISKVSAENYSNEDIWLGALQAPEAFVAASKQAVAQAHSWSLEDLSLKITIDDKSNSRADSFTFVGMELQGASWQAGALAIDNNELACKLPPVRFTWVKDMKASESSIKVPVYLDYTREQYLFSVNLECPKNIPSSVWSQRGICLVVWTA